MTTAGPARHPTHVRSLSAPAAPDIPLQPLWELDLSDAEAERISQLIDEELKKEQQRRKEARKKEIKVMLLGQAESGKSTLQKQFQLYYASQTLEHERPSWRPIVYFNIIKAVRMTLDELDYLFAAQASGNAEVVDSEIDRPTPEMLEEILAIRGRLLPLIAIESSLAFELSGGVSVIGGRSDVFVRGGWQALTSRGRSGHDVSTPPNKTVAVTNLAARTLNENCSDVQALWKQPVVQNLVRLQKLKLDESAPFFLHNIERVAEPDYLPTTDDILNVRLQTLGVTEHIFDIVVAGSRYMWKLYDVGAGTAICKQRHAWVPYFDDATAIIFLAPLSAFDQYLDEDMKTNRIDDSLQLFTAICTNQLLKNTHLVLLLNKVDLLKKKLEAGLKVRKYITSYGHRPNRYEDVAEYFRAHFVQVHKKKDISRRSLYVHFTSMLDIKATQGIIINVGEAIIRSHIAKTGLA
ncbi:hypothetical protein CCMSSC00406_0003875 [Pleurotus cornucopiae]|uniref:Uncharacterized protein n=1 Tax=Pleurotus cornucopiae TaxID=5321 RepID=A0ACB7ISA4_PLECO|nr:hypothetical protein CCMSSC00406_0003875 [Pleurotus cornucopiae]